MNGFEPLDKELLSKRLTTIGDICREIGKRPQNFFESYVRSPRRSKKYPPFPEPIVRLRCGNIYDREDIMAFLEAISKQKLAKRLSTRKNERLSTKKSEIEQLLNCESMQILKPIERKILFLRYGIESNKSLTLNEISKIFNLTRQRISQIELKTIAKLKKYYQTKINKSK